MLFNAIIKRLKLYKRLLKISFQGLPAPSILPIQLTNACNCRCVFCQYPYNTDRKGVMDFITFKKIISECKDFNIKKIHLIGSSGEVFLDNNENTGIIQKIKYARNNGIEVYVTTNGTMFLENSLYRNILDSGIAYLYISTPGFSEESYKRLFGVNNYEKILKGILKLLEYKKNNKFDTMIYFGFRLDRKIEDALLDKDYIELIQPYVVDGILVGRDHRVEFDTWAGEVDFTKTSINKVLSLKNKGLCPKLYTPQLSILYDGSVKLCGCTYKKTEFDEMVIGNINDGLKSSLQSEKVRNLIKNYIYFRRIPYICSECTRPEDRKT